MKKIFIITILNFLVPLTIFLILPSILIRSRQGISSINGDNLLSFVESKPLTISFISNLDNFQNLTLHLKNPSIKNNSKITVDINSPIYNRSIVFYGSNVGDPSQVPLKFPPFEEKSGTKYTVTLSTDNTIHDSLYLITDDHNIPLFNTYYKTTNIKKNFRTNFSYQLNQFKNRSLYHNVFYLSLILLLDLLILFRRGPKT
jgi:hypothetical protein